MDSSPDRAARFGPREGLDISPERWPDVSRVFSAALQLDRTARESYLDDACRNDTALRAAVDSLLVAHDAAGSFGDALLLPLPRAVKRLAPGSRLGPFRVEALLGEGGMGEVYRAHDTKLQRPVALKVLPDSFADDPDRRARFDEEARALAALSHPHVGAIFGVEESGPVVALVLELIEGPTLAERLAAGPMALDDVLRIARQIAEGLEAAHERGIVHRDLKPANIKITPDGNVKILDFGLAKADGAANAASPGDSPGSRQATAVGAIIGTATYMSPEQAQGLPADRRTDIWAYGCVLFEMCARRPPFAGDTVAETLRAVIEREPDWAHLPSDTPPAVIRLLRRCLVKDPKTRLRDIGEARIALTAGADAEAPVKSRGIARRLVAAGAIGAALATGAIAGVAIYRSLFTAPAARVRFEVRPPDSGVFGFHPGQVSFALSPDGSTLAYVAATGSGPLASTRGGRRIWLRALGDLDASPVPGTEDAVSVFWSPDGRSLAFITNSQLMRVDLPARAVVKICDLVLGSFHHGSWGAGNIILLGKGNGTVIERVPAAGGAPERVLAADRSRREVRVHWPLFLPDGERFLYTARLDNDEGVLRLGRLDGTSQPVMPVGSNTQWVDPDIVLFVREGTLLGQRLDLDSARPVGEPFPVAERVEYFLTASRARFSASRNGVVAIHRGTDLRQYVWLDGTGREVGTAGTIDDYHPENGRLSPDDTRLLTARRRPGPGTYDIWLLDLARGTEERLTAGQGSELGPIWMEGERAILYGGDSPGTVPHLFRKDLVTGAAEPLLPPGNQQYPVEVLPENRGVVFIEAISGGFKGFVLPLEPRGAPRPLLHPMQDVLQPRLSPDGRAIAYLGLESNRRGVYVASMAATDPPVLAAQGAQDALRWSRDGRQVYFVDGDNYLTSVPVRTSPGVTVGTTRPLFKMPRGSTLMDVSRDGRFLVLVPRVLAVELPIVVDTAAVGPGRE